MPGPPRGHGRGGAGWRPPRAKAAPIARPSVDYELKLQQREYGGDEKKRRDEARREEMERRQAARSSGEAVDLGRSGKYWEQVAHSKTQAPRQAAARGADRGRWEARAEPGSDSWSRDGAWSKWRPEAASNAPPDTDSWSSGYPRSRSEFEGGAANHCNGGGGEQYGWGSSANGGAAGWSSGHFAKGAESAGKGGDVDGQGSAQSSTVMERVFTIEEKARRAALRLKEAEERQQARQRAGQEGQATPSTVVSTLSTVVSTPSTVVSTAAEGLRDTEKPAEELLRSLSRQPEALSLQLAGKCYGDEHLAALCAECTEKLERGEAVWPAAGLVVDLRGNSVTDTGLGCLLATLCKTGAQPTELLLTGNPLEEPMALVDLVKHKQAGLSKRLWHLEVSAGQLSEECLWRILEACVKLNPRPPLRLGFLNGELGKLDAVVWGSLKHGIKVDRQGLEPGKVASLVERMALDADLELVHADPASPAAAAAAWDGESKERACH